jgi:ribonuclease I
MPGVQSNLQRHEWIVHGTCFGGAADDYFARAAGFAEAVNASGVAKLFADNVGKSLSVEARSLCIRPRLWRGCRHPALRSPAMDAATIAPSRS